MARNKNVSFAEDLLTKSNNVLNAAKKGASTAFVGASDSPDDLQNRQLRYLEEVDRLLKRPSLTPTERQRIKKIRVELRKNYVTSGGVLDKVGDPDRFPAMGQKSKATTGTAQAANAAKQLDRMGSGIRSPLALGGLLGASVPETPPPGMPPKATRSIPGIMPEPEPFTPRTVGTARDRLMNPRSRAPRSGSDIGSTRSTVWDKNGRRQSPMARGPSIKLPQVPSPRPAALQPWAESPRPQSVYGINPAAERATMGTRRDMVPDGRPMPQGARPEYMPGSKSLAVPENNKSFQLRDKLKNFDLAKAGKIGGKIAKGGLLGLPLLALDYMAPGNAIASSRKEGYGMLDDMGLDVQGGIDSIDNPLLRGGAGLLDGLVVDPAMTVVGGAKKFKEMISRDIKAARKRRKNRSKDWKPKTYRGSRGKRVGLV